MELLELKIMGVVMLPIVRLLISVGGPEIGLQSACSGVLESPNQVISPEESAWITAEAFRPVFGVMSWMSGSEKKQA